MNYRFKIRGSNYRLMRSIWYILKWTSRSHSWDKIKGYNYHDKQVDTYYLIRLYPKGEG